MIDAQMTLTLLTTDLEVLKEVSINEAVAEQTPVSVGWGREETQFRGKAGKFDPSKVATQAASGDARFDLPSHAWITWRGDGEAFATSTIGADQTCSVRVWTQYGELEATSQALPGLELPISWQPSGALIAGVQRLKHKYQIVFLERNALEHGNFDLPALCQPQSSPVSTKSCNTLSYLP